MGKALSGKEKTNRTTLYYTSRAGEARYGGFKT